MQTSTPIMNNRDHTMNSGHMGGQETATKMNIVAPFTVTSPLAIADELEDK
jgi:hypothetical protein